jgi:hypothetical protein
MNNSLPSSSKTEAVKTSDLTIRHSYAAEVLQCIIQILSSTNRTELLRHSTKPSNTSSSQAYKALDSISGIGYRLLNTTLYTYVIDHHTADSISHLMKYRQVKDQTSVTFGSSVVESISTSSSESNRSCLVLRPKNSGSLV